MKKVYILLQEYEDSDLLRETTIIGVYTCMTKAKNELKRIRKEDSTGLFKDNGFEYKSDTCSRSKYIYDVGFVCLYIEEKEVF